MSQTWVVAYRRMQPPSFPYARQCLSCGAPVALRKCHGEQCRIALSTNPNPLTRPRRVTLPGRSVEALTRGVGVVFAAKLLNADPAGQGRRVWGADPLALDVPA